MANTFKALARKAMQIQATITLKAAGESVASQIVDSFGDNHSSDSDAESENLYKSSSLEPNESSEQELDYMIGDIKTQVSYLY